MTTTKPSTIPYGACQAIASSGLDGDTIYALTQVNSHFKCLTSMHGIIIIEDIKNKFNILVKSCFYNNIMTNISCILENCEQIMNNERNIDSHRLDTIIKWLKISQQTNNPEELRTHYAWARIALAHSFKLAPRMYQLHVTQYEMGVSVSLQLYNGTFLRINSKGNTLELNNNIEYNPFLKNETIDLEKMLLKRAAKNGDRAVVTISNYIFGDREYYNITKDTNAAYLVNTEFHELYLHTKIREHMIARHIAFIQVVVDFMHAWNTNGRVGGTHVKYTKTQDKVNTVSGVRNVYKRIGTQKKYVVINREHVDYESVKK